MEGDGSGGKVEAKALPKCVMRRKEEMERAEVRAEASCSTSMDDEEAQLF